MVSFPSQIHTKARTEVQLEFKDAGAYAFDVRKISRPDPSQPDSDSGLRRIIQLANPIRVPASTKLICVFANLQH